MRGSTWLASSSAWLTGARRARRARGEFVLPHLRRGCGIVSQPAPQAVELPVAFELVIVEAVGGAEDVERLFVVRLAEHLGGQHFVDLEAVAIVHPRGGGEAAHVRRVAPQQKARGAPLHTCQCTR